MAFTQIQKLELNKRVEKILHAPSNAPISGQQLEMAFVADLAGDTAYVHDAVKDAAAALKSHDKIFQNVRSNMVYWGSGKIMSKVMPMPFIQMGKVFEDIAGDIMGDNVDKTQNFEELCGYLKLFHARCRCILLFMDCSYSEFEKSRFRAEDMEKAAGNLNPFLKYRILAVTRDKMVTGTQMLLKFVNWKA